MHQQGFSASLLKISRSSQIVVQSHRCLPVLFRVCSSTSKKHQQVHSCLSASVQSLLKYIQKVRDSQGMSRCFCVKSLLQKLQKPRVRVHVCRLLSKAFQISPKTNDPDHMSGCLCLGFCSKSIKMVSLDVYVCLPLPKTSNI